MGRRDRDNTVDLDDVEIIARTDKAILIEIDDGSTEPEIGVNRFWIPFSLMQSVRYRTEAFAWEDPETGEQCQGTRDIADIELPEWFVYNDSGLRDALDFSE